MKEEKSYQRIEMIIDSTNEDVALTRRKGATFKFPIFADDKLKVTSIESLDLSVRSYNSLKRAGIDKLGDLFTKISCSSDLKSIRNCGQKSVDEIMDHLCFYQYSVLDEKGKEAFRKKLIELNT